MAEKMVGIPDFDQATAEGYRTKSLVDAREATHSLIDQVNSRAEWLMARINMYRSGDQIVKFTPASMHYRLHPMEPFPGRVAGRTTALLANLRGRLLWPDVCAACGR